MGPYKFKNFLFLFPSGMLSLGDSNVVFFLVALQEVLAQVFFLFVSSMQHVELTWLKWCCCFGDGVFLPPSSLALAPLLCFTLGFCPPTSLGVLCPWVVLFVSSQVVCPCAVLAWPACVWHMAGLWGRCCAAPIAFRQFGKDIESCMNLYH